MLTREVKLTHLRIHRLGEHPPVLGDVLHHLLQRRPLHLLPLQVGEGVGDEVEEDAALSDLLDQKLLAIALAGLLQLGQLHQLPVLTDVEPRRQKCWKPSQARANQICWCFTKIAVFRPAGTLASFLLYVAGTRVPWIIMLKTNKSIQMSTAVLI